MPKENERTEEEQVVRKVYRRIMWFLVLLFICSYLDRINISFAALTMNTDLGLTATMFGLANTVFYVAYVLAEVPSNMMMPRVGARLWIPRIMIPWGLISCATMFAVGPNSLYALRALLGLAEAGFMPCILLYLTYWFPPVYRARASALFIMAQPVTILFASTVSGLILQMDGFLGLAGWRWLFLLEGIPSVILGVAAYFYLSDNPAKAAWLSAREKEVLHTALERADMSVVTKNVGRTLRRELFSPPIMLLSFAYMGLVISLSTNSMWVPQIVRSLVPNQSFALVGLIAAIPSFVTILLMPIWGRRSDRLQERRWHTVLPMLLAATGWIVIASLEDPTLRMVGLIACSVGAFSAQAIFWTLPANYLSPKSRPIGIALVNSIGVTGTTFGPLVIGSLRDATGNWAAALAFVACALCIGATCVALVSRRSRPAAVEQS